MFGVPRDIILCDAYYRMIVNIKEDTFTYLENEGENVTLFTCLLLFTFHLLNFFKFQFVRYHEALFIFHVFFSGLGRLNYFLSSAVRIPFTHIRYNKFDLLRTL